MEKYYLETNQSNNDDHMLEIRVAYQYKRLFVVLMS